MELVVRTLMAAVVATLLIDIWATLANRLLGLPRTNWAMVGRWLGHMPRGRFIHHPISASPSIEHERLLGWVFHYLIGFIYACLYVVLLQCLPGRSPSLLSAWLFGLVTVVSPWFIMQPGLGLGICAAKAPQPNQVRLQNLIIHSLFGVGLYLGWQLSFVLW